MALSFTNVKKRVNDKRRENKKRGDLLKKGSYKHEVDHVFNKFYRDQVSELYRMISNR